MSNAAPESSLEEMILVFNWPCACAGDVLSGRRPGLKLRDSAFSALAAPVHWKFPGLFSFVPGFRGRLLACQWPPDASFSRYFLSLLPQQERCDGDWNGVPARQRRPYL